MMFDTANTIKWSKIIKKSGLVYEVWGVLALSDGGALIFSRYYDPNYSRRLHSQISVIKIQGDGRILNEQIYDLPQTPALSLHPNPTEGELNLDLPPSRQGQGARYRIYKISGALELEGAYRPGELLDVSALPRGTYLLRMQWDNGTVQKGRFVKK